MADWGGVTSVEGGGGGGGGGGTRPILCHPPPSRQPDPTSGMSTNTVCVGSLRCGRLA